MTKATHVERLRTVALPAAAALAKGPTGVALFAAKQGYGAAKTGRKARRARAMTPSITRGRALQAPRAAQTHAAQSRSLKRVALLGVLAAIAVGAVAYLARGRKEQPPVAPAPPSLSDYGPAGAGVPVI